MRCECASCGMYMVHAEDMTLGCICPECTARCTACLGTNSVLSKEQLRELGKDPLFEKQLLEHLEHENEEDF